MNNHAQVTLKGIVENVCEYENETEEGRAQNRRVEFLITAKEKLIAEAAAEAEKK